MFEKFIFYFYLVSDRSEEMNSVIKEMLNPDYKSRPTVDEILAIPAVRTVSCMSLILEILSLIHIIMSNPNLR